MKGLLEIDEHNDGQGQRDQTNGVTDDVKEGGQLDDGLELRHEIGCRQMEAIVIVAVRIPGSVRMTISRCILYIRIQLFT